MPVRNLCHIFSKCSACWVKISAISILKYFSYFYQKIGFDISCKLGDNKHNMYTHYNHIAEMIPKPDPDGVRVST